MEFVIAIALLAFFWYAAYRAWTGRVPKGTRRFTIIVAHNVRTADYYLEQFGMYFDRSVRIATRPMDLYGYRPEDANFIYVNSDNAKPNPEVVQRLRELEGAGAEVDWVGYPNEEW